MRRIFFISASLLVFSAFAQLPAYAPVENLVAWYSFSGNVLDNSGNGHNNADYGIVLTTDRFNTPLKALHYLGTGSEYLNYGDVDDFEGFQEASFSFWIKPEQYGGNSEPQMRPVISKWAGPNEYAASSYKILMSDQELRFDFSDGSAAHTVTTTLTHTPINLWSHVVVTFNHGAVRIYSNNTLLKDTVLSMNQINSASSDFKVGGWFHETDNSYAVFYGKIDDIGIWNRELNTCEIEALYTATVCASATTNELTKPERHLVYITDLMGRPTAFVPNTLLLYVYSDGTTEKVFRAAY